MSDTGLSNSVGYVCTNVTYKYGLNYTNVLNFQKEISTTTFWDNMKYLFSDPSDWITSLRKYPFDVNDYLIMTTLSDNPLPVTEKIKIGNTTLESSTGISFFNSKYGYLKLATVDFNSIIEKNNNFLDFSPYTTYQLYLPYSGFIDLDSNLIFQEGKKIGISVSVDLDTGKGGYYLTLENSNSTESQLILSKEATFGIDIPIGATNANDNARSTFLSSTLAVGGTAASAVTGNVIPAALGVLNLTKSLVTSNILTPVMKGGNASGFNNICLPNKLYLIITRQKHAPINYAKTKGYPLNEQVDRLGSLSGFTKVGAVHLEGFPDSTSDELSEIESLLTQGVIL